MKDLSRYTPHDGINFPGNQYQMPSHILCSTHHILSSCFLVFFPVEGILFPLLGLSGSIKRTTRRTNPTSSTSNAKSSSIALPTASIMEGQMKRKSGTRVLLACAVKTMSEALVYSKLARGPAHTGGLDDEEDLHVTIRVRKADGTYLTQWHEGEWTSSYHVPIESEEMVGMSRSQRRR